MSPQCASSSDTVREIKYQILQLIKSNSAAVRERRACLQSTRIARQFEMLGCAWEALPWVAYVKADVGANVLPRPTHRNSHATLQAVKRLRLDLSIRKSSSFFPSLNAIPGPRQHSITKPRTSARSRAPGIRIFLSHAVPAA